MNLHQDLKEYYNPPAKNGVHYTSKIRTEILILTNSYRDVSITTKKIGSRYFQGLGDWTSLSLNYTFDEESKVNLTENKFIFNNILFSISAWIKRI